MDTDFSVVIDLLQARGIRFVIVGGVAVALNGYVRATEDLDIIVDADPENVASMLDALCEWGEGFAVDLSATDFTLEPGAIRLIEDFPLDIFTLLSQKPYEEYAKRARRTSGGIPFLHPEDLISSKKSSMREKDKLDIFALKRLIAAERNGR